MTKDEKTVGLKKSADVKDFLSKSVKAGKRTYFIDVKRNRSRGLYLTITESKKRYLGEGTVVFEKHKIFLFNEDFDKFRDAFLEILDCIDDLREKENLCGAEIVENSGK